MAAAQTSATLEKLKIKVTDYRQNETLPEIKEYFYEKNKINSFVKLGKALNLDITSCDIFVSYHISQHLQYIKNTEDIEFNKLVAISIECKTHQQILDS